MTTRARENDAHRDLEPTAKRSRTEEDDSSSVNLGDQSTQDMIMQDATVDELPFEPAHRYIIEDLLPPSRSLLSAGTLADRPKDQINFTLEADVGITEYIGKDVPPIHGIIKQR